MNKSVTGKKGEDFCAQFLTKIGFSVLCRNYHSRYGEIDIIAENENFLIFVEVKTRDCKSLSMPCEAVDYLKQKKIILTAQKYLSECEKFRQPRFDVFEVWLSEGRIYKFNHIENAFDESTLGGKFEIF